MRIQSRIWISIIVSVAISSIIALSAFSILRGVDHELARSQIYNQVIDKVFALDILTDNIHEESDARSMKQIGRVRVTLTRLLDGMSSTNGREEFLVKQIRRNNRELGLLIDRYLEPRPEPKGSLESERRKMLASQLQVKVRLVTDDTNRLIEISRSRIVSAQAKAGVTVLMLIGILVISTALIFYISHRGLVRAQDELEVRVQERTAELVKASETLREQASLLDLASEAILVRDMDAQIVYWNRGAEKKYGWTKEEALGKICHVLLQSQFPKPLEEITAEVVESGHWEGEVSHKTKDGNTLVVASRTVVQKDARGNPLGFLVINRDITERKRTEEAVKSYMAKLEQSNKALQDFASIASHDMQEPLRKVASFGNLLKKKYGEPLGEGGNDYLDRMLSATSRMQSLLASLLQYSRVTSKAQPLREVNLAEIVRDVLSDLEARIHRDRAEVRVDTLPVIQADPTQMRQLFQNLIGNALKFNKKGEKPVIQVRSGSTGNPVGAVLALPSQQVQIMVEDNGIGFEEKHLGKIFAPFERLHGKQEYPGTGMGLAICKKIVERHGGSITARSAPGTGSTFIVTLPV